MDTTETRTARQVMIGLVAAGAAMAAIGATALDPRVATVLPPIGAALVAAGVVIQLQAEAVGGRRALVIGIALVTAGVIMAIVGSVVPQAAVTAAVVPLGGALAAAGTVSLVSGAASVGSKVRLGAR